MAQFALPLRNPQASFATFRGIHVALRVPDYARAMKWYTEKLDFRIVVEWSFAGMRLAYLAPADDDNAVIEIIGDGDVDTTSDRGAKDLAGSLRVPGYHHYCFNVPSVEDAAGELRRRGVSIFAEPFVLPDISRRLAFFTDPFGNLFELSEIVD